MKETMTVGEVAALTGVTVRTLHHYDAIGLVRPAARSAAGYRLYGPDDVARLQEVVAYRRLGFGLEDIPAPSVDRRGALIRQRELVTARVDELTRLGRALDAALAEHEDEHQDEHQDEREEDTMEDHETTRRPGARPDLDLTDAELRELFGDEYAEEFDGYQAEAERRWGATDAWAESARRTKRHTKADWERIKAEQDEANRLLAAAMRAGEPPSSEAAMDAAEAARAVMGRWFFEASPAMHRDLGDMYVADPRFAKTYDDVEPGLAAYLRDAIHANADRLERDA
ncbi:MerR family transcriptional regulator [Micrococcus sp. HG099]|uniref:MerR family transcriptional regulator n=1 Tax=Micrococcus sp. HG099 TaxID=2969755 RepID=UPI00215A6685|nr:MerR family transcriptional regulator [Micrococcus sp. HG099]MCR8675306.1 MerR family transcriptional regulator [Micrococcus sp. HG099]